MVEIRFKDTLYDELKNSDLGCTNSIYWDVDDHIWVPIWERCGIYRELIDDAIKERCKRIDNNISENELDINFYFINMDKLYEQLTGNIIYNLVKKHKEVNKLDIFLSKVKYDRIMDVVVSVNNQVVTNVWLNLSLVRILRLNFNSQENSVFESSYDKL